MLAPLILAGIVIVPKYMRELRKVKAYEKELDLKEMAMKRAQSPADVRRIQAISKEEWAEAQIEAQKLIKSQMNLEKHAHGRSMLAPTLDDLKRMEGYVYPGELLVREIELEEWDEWEPIIVEGRKLRPKCAPDLITFGILVNRQFDEGTWDGLSLNSNEGLAKLYQDWWMMLGFDSISAEELAWSGDKPWFDINAQAAGLI